MNEFFSSKLNFEFYGARVQEMDFPFRSILHVSIISIPFFGKTIGNISDKTCMLISNHLTDKTKPQPLLLVCPVNKKKSADHSIHQRTREKKKKRSSSSKLRQFSVLRPEKIKLKRIHYTFQKETFQLPLSLPVSNS